MSDDISMKALQGSIGDRCRQAVTAGCDVALVCNQSLADRAAAAAAAGEMTEAAQTRAMRALAMRKRPQELDIDAAEAELSCLMSGQVYDG